MSSWGSEQEEKNRDKLCAEQIREGQVGSLMGVGAIGVVEKMDADYYAEGLVLGGERKKRTSEESLESKKISEHGSRSTKYLNDRSLC